MHRTKIADWSTGNTGQIMVQSDSYDICTWYVVYTVTTYIHSCSWSCHVLLTCGHGVCMYIWYRRSRSPKKKRTAAGSFTDTVRAAKFEYAAYAVRVPCARTALLFPDCLRPTSCVCTTYVYIRQAYGTFSPCTFSKKNMGARDTQPILELLRHFASPVKMVCTVLRRTSR